MEVRIKKSQEPKVTKGILGTSLKLTLEISVSLSDDERALVQNYNDPSIAFLELRPYFSSDANISVVKIESKETRLSQYRIVAHIENGLNNLGDIQKFEDAVLSELKGKLDFLRSLNEWQGEETVSI